MAVREGRVQRSMNALSFGTVRDISERKDKLDKTRLSERDQQFQFAVRGDAFPNGIAWSFIDLKFRVEFVNATGQRDSPYVVPTFTYGARIRTPNPVMLSVAVMRWEQDDRETIQGCRLAVGVLGDFVAFRADVHANFQGFGAPREDEEDEGF